MVISTSDDVYIEGITFTKGHSNRGGGIENYAPLELNNVRLHDNYGESGGGIYSGQNPLTVKNSRIDQNHGRGSGGIHIVGSAQASLRLINSTVDGNTSNSVGGLSVHGNSEIVNSTISNNTSTRSTGGITAGGELLILNSTISGNHAGDGGAGLSVQSSTGVAVTVINSTIVKNTVNHSSGGGVSSYNEGRDRALTMHNTIVAGNIVLPASAPTPADVVGSGAVYFTSSHNLIGSAGNSLGLTDGSNGNIVGINGSGNRLLEDIVGPLADNGGATLTHALLADSAAIDAGRNSILPTDSRDFDGNGDTSERIPFDQRAPGIDRVINGHVDIGAFEFSDVPPPATIEDVSFYNQDAILEDGLSVDSTGQRSIIKHIQMVINGEVTVPTGAVTNSSFVLTNLDASTSIGLSIDSSTPSGGKTTVVLSFTSGTDTNGSLVDGNYALMLNGTLLGIDADGSGSVGGTRTINFHRLFGDSDGDRDVDGADYGSVYQAYFGRAAHRNAFDQSDNDNLFDDFSDFFSNFGTVLNPFGT